MKVKLIKAQSSLEFAVAIVCVVAALLTMQVYVKRSFQGRMRQTADSIGEQYAPGNTTSNITLTSSGSHTMTTNTEEINGLATVTITDLGSDVQTHQGWERAGALD